MDFQTEHRPWPIPTGQWLMKQQWLDLLFIHWPMRSEDLRPFLPYPLELETYDGNAWIGLVPFRMSDIRYRALGQLPTISAFAEINVRTYVTYKGKPGVFFFSLDAASWLAVQGARKVYHLPYYWANMSCEEKDQVITYTSRRKGSGDQPRFEATYKPTSAIQFAQPDTLEHWLTERYCLYTVHRKKVYRGDIHHNAWSLQDAQLSLKGNTMLSAQHLPPIGDEEHPLLHFSKQLQVWIWPLRRL